MGGCPILCALGKGWDTRRSVSRFVVSHPSQKSAKDGAPGDLLDDYKESRMRRVDSTKPYRKFGGNGAPVVLSR
jgi:hypothetical protein